ncbi:MarR family winged helix-turn-helix transcriptional regulator [Mesorhizobium retamae]|uniref:MarR family winged helix-turn-helix transcriptional regulator n=1 Tax=Mesorhizobium retamae TaxID=2912854 RepID=A0ABS9Q9K1_9HYPH|nr:MarR family winged helix-turn-helix transcriptional regulator [Mesorhizobium sp. IRAMC:0171]MCG7504087.1 MarR family winged helix-turn-helix transcriptional regulator [Mesorhizobium sp. IRAMC:0171]
MFELASTPIGLDLAQTAKIVRRAFDDAMVAKGGSLPVWSVLISVKSRQFGHQRELAESVGIQGATLTHHLNAMEADGLVTRRRDPANRRKHLVELTPSGEALFLRLRDTAIAFDRQLRAGLALGEIDAARSILARLRANVGGESLEVQESGADQ